MKRFIVLLLTFGLVFTVGHWACNDHRPDTTTSANQQPTPPPAPRLTVRDSNGRSYDIAPNPPPAPILTVQDFKGGSHDIALDPQTDILYMATWCPHSKALTQMLSDSSMQPYLKDRQIVFLFGRKEWKTVAKEMNDMVKSGDMRADQVQPALDRLRKKAHNSVVFDPDFIKALPGTAYIADEPSELDGYPTARVESRFNSASAWMRKELNMPSSVIEALYAQYDPPNNSTDDTPAGTGAN